METSARRGGAAMKDSEIACARLVETGDPERFRAIMAVPVSYRRPLWPLHALNLEVARAPWASKEPLVAEMRLQWWVDALERLADDGVVPPHEIGPALGVLRPVAPILSALADARRVDCWPDPFTKTDDLWLYLDGTAGNRFWASAKLLGAPDSEEPRVREQGTAMGLAAYLMAVPELERLGRHPLPDGRADAIAQLAAQGRDTLRIKTSLSKPARCALLPGWEAEAVLSRVAREPGRVAAGAFHGAEIGRRFGLLRAAWRC